MNRYEAKKLAGSITNEQIVEMLKTAKEKVKNWEGRSKVNSSITMGTSWNILAKDFNPDETHHILYKTNLIREFGEFLPDNIKNSVKKPKKDLGNPIHQNPEF